MNSTMAMVGAAELLIIIVVGLLALLLIGGIVALVVFLTRKGASAQDIDRRLQALEKDVADLKDQKKE